jgi:hypothetical protein
MFGTMRERGEDDARQRRDQDIPVQPPRKREISGFPSLKQFIDRIVAQVDTASSLRSIARFDSRDCANQRRLG